MNIYVVPIKRFFSGYELFKVEAECKEDAIKIAKNMLLHLGLEIIILMTLEKLKRKNNYGEKRFL